MSEVRTVALSALGETLSSLAVVASVVVVLGQTHPIRSRWQERLRALIPFAGGVNPWTAAAVWLFCSFVSLASAGVARVLFLNAPVTDTGLDFTDTADGAESYYDALPLIFGAQKLLAASWIAIYATYGMRVAREPGEREAAELNRVIWPLIIAGALLFLNWCAVLAVFIVGLTDLVACGVAPSLLYLPSLLFTTVSFVMWLLRLTCLPVNGDKTVRDEVEGSYIGVSAADAHGATQEEHNPLNPYPQPLATPTTYNASLANAGAGAKGINVDFY
jgi:hypothetical protein